MNSKILCLTDNNFNKIVLDSKCTILVDFWASWCGPCKSIDIILNEIADEFFNIIKIAKLNIEQNPISTQNYEVRSIPMLLLFKNGKILEKKIGLLSKLQLKQFIQNNL